MKRIVRNPMKFEALNLLAQHSLNEDLSILSTGALDGLLTQLRTSLSESVQNKILLYGQRAEGMFEALVSSLGHFRVFKKEDAGNVFVSDDTLQVPDFRVVLEDGSQLLIEVKNYGGQPDLSKQLKMTHAYFDGLVRYAALMGCELKFAVYWSASNMWALVPPSAFQRRARSMRLTMKDALVGNEMHLLGDRWIGTKFPLCIRFHADPAHPRNISAEGQVDFRIKAVEMFCADRAITDPVELNIAFFLMMHGSWRESEEADVTDSNLNYIQLQYAPGQDQGYGFELIGTLSSMYCSSYNLRTLNEDGVTQLQVDSTPGFLSRLLLGEHTRDALPLWIFNVRPDEPH